jgi:nitrogen regulatory protein PII
MKKLEAVIAGDAVSRVTEVLESRGVSHFMFNNVMARDISGGHFGMYRGHAYELELSEEVKLEAVAPDEQASEIAYAVLDAARGPGRSYRPRVTLAPINEVIIELSEPAADTLNGEAYRRTPHAQPTRTPSVLPPPLQPSLLKLVFFRSLAQRAKRFLSVHFAPPHANASTPLT